MSEVKNEGLEVLRARIVELEQNLAYFPSTVRSLAETVTEREAEINQLRAELAAPVQQVSVPDVLREAIKWADHLCFECGALVQTRAPSVHVYNKTFEAVQAAKAMLAAAPAAPAVDAGVNDHD